MELMQFAARIIEQTNNLAYQLLGPFSWLIYFGVIFYLFQLVMEVGLRYFPYFTSVLTLGLLKIKFSYDMRTFSHKLAIYAIMAPYLRFTNPVGEVVINLHNIVKVAGSDPDQQNEFGIRIGGSTGVGKTITLAQGFGMIAIQHVHDNYLSIHKDSGLGICMTSDILENVPVYTSINTERLPRSNWMHPAAFTFELLRETMIEVVMETTMKFAKDIYKKKESNLAVMIEAASRGQGLIVNLFFDESNVFAEWYRRNVPYTNKIIQEVIPHIQGQIGKKIVNHFGRRKLKSLLGEAGMNLEEKQESLIKQLEREGMKVVVCTGLATNMDIVRTIENSGAGDRRLRAVDLTSPKAKLAIVEFEVMSRMEEAIGKECMDLSMKTTYDEIASMMLNRTTQIVKKDDMSIPYLLEMYAGFSGVEFDSEEKKFQFGVNDTNIMKENGNNKQIGGSCPCTGDLIRNLFNGFYNGISKEERLRSIATMRKCHQNIKELVSNNVALAEQGNEKRHGLITEFVEAAIGNTDHYMKRIMSTSWLLMGNIIISTARRYAGVQASHQRNKSVDMVGRIIGILAGSSQEIYKSLAASQQDMQRLFKTYWTMPIKSFSEKLVGHQETVVDDLSKCNESSETDSTNREFIRDLYQVMIRVPPKALGDFATACKSVFQDLKIIRDMVLQVMNEFGVERKQRNQDHRNIFSLFNNLHVSEYIMVNQSQEQNFVAEFIYNMAEEFYDNGNDARSISLKQWQETVTQEQKMATQFTCDVMKVIKSTIHSLDYYKESAGNMAPQASQGNWMTIMKNMFSGLTSGIGSTIGTVFTGVKDIFRKKSISEIDDSLYLVPNSNITDPVLMANNIRARILNKGAESELDKFRINAEGINGLTFDISSSILIALVSYFYRDSQSILNAVQRLCDLANNSFEQLDNKLIAQSLIEKIDSSPIQREFLISGIASLFDCINMSRVDFNTGLQYLASISWFDRHLTLGDSSAVFKALQVQFSNGNRLFRYNPSNPYLDTKNDIRKIFIMIKATQKLESIKIDANQKAKIRRDMKDDQKSQLDILQDWWNKTYKDCEDTNRETKEYLDKKNLDSEREKKDLNDAVNSEVSKWIIHNNKDDISDKELQVVKYHMEKTAKESLQCGFETNATFRKQASIQTSSQLWTQRPTV